MILQAFMLGSKGSAREAREIMTVQGAGMGPQEFVRLGPNLQRLHLPVSKNV